MFFETVKKIPTSLNITFIFLASVSLISCGGEGGGDGGGPSFGPNSIVLSWKAPTTNVDQSCIGNDLAGFEIHYGNSPGTYNDSATLPIAVASCVATGEVTACGNVQVCTTSVDNLPSATWYVAVSAYDLAGNDGPLSNEASYSF